MTNNKIQWIDSSKFPQWLELFNDIFKANMSESTLKWKYKGVEKIGSALSENGKLVAFYGGMPRDILYKSKIIKGVQIGDVMVHLSQRGAFTRKGAFWKLAIAYIDTFIGKDKAYSIAFGFPSKRAYMLGKRCDLYDEVDSLIELSWIKKKIFKFSYFRWREWDSSDIVHVEKIWKKMALSLRESILGVRNTQWFKHRYLEHPDSPYDIICVHRLWNKEPEAILILRKTAENTMELVDIIGDVNLMEGFCAVALNYSRKAASQKLFCWMTRSHLDIFQKTNPIVNELDIVIPFSTKNVALNQDDVSKKWWLMSGDTDFR